MLATDGRTRSQSPRPGRKLTDAFRSTPLRTCHQRVRRAPGVTLLPSIPRGDLGRSAEAPVVRRNSGALGRRRLLTPDHGLLAHPEATRQPVGRLLVARPGRPADAARLRIGLQVAVPRAVRVHPRDQAATMLAASAGVRKVWRGIVGHGRMVANGRLIACARRRARGTAMPHWLATQAHAAGCRMEASDRETAGTLNVASSTSGQWPSRRLR